MDNLTPINIICGPTGSGKTAAAIKLAEQARIEIISADSRQVYKRLDIGTAKPTQAEKSAVRFHLVDIIEPGEKYSAARFIDDASAAIDAILSRDTAPVVVGGTGLYLRALSEGVVEIAANDGSIRAQLEQEMATIGPEKMHEKLVAIDPREAAGFHPNNRVRVIRALEIFLLTGKTKTELVATSTYKKCAHNFTFHCLSPEREELYRDINERVDAMMRLGLLGEVERLVSDGMGPAVRHSNVIGYNELLDYFDNQCSLDEAVASIKQNSRKYAKRQMTWFRHQVQAKHYEDKNSLVEALLAK